MQEFFKSKLFKGLFVLAASLSGLIAFEITANRQIFLKRIISALANPVCSVTSSINNSVSGFFDEIFGGGFHKERNELLEREIAKMRKNLIEYENLKSENERLKQLINIKNSNKDFEVEMAKVIAKNPDELCKFTVDAGSSKGIENGAAVISEKGLIGIVTKVEKNSCEIETILSVNVAIPSINISKEEQGTICGRSDLINQNLCTMLHLSKQTNCEVGDLVSTSSGKESFPKDIVIGKIKKIELNPNGISNYAIIEPTENLNSIRNVLIIKNFQ